MKIFNAGDIIQFAIRIEEDGEVFYRTAAENAQDKKARDLFVFFANEEAQHKVLFEDMFRKIEIVGPAETYDSEYAAYLADYIDGKVVFTKEAQQRIVPDLKDILSVITFAMGRETDSILYYHETKRFVEEKYHSIVDKIIAEERKHFSKLSEMRKEYM